LNKQLLTNNQKLVNINININLLYSDLRFICEQQKKTKQRYRNKKSVLSVRKPRDATVIKIWVLGSERRMYFEAQKWTFKISQGR